MAEESFVEGPRPDFEARSIAKGVFVFKRGRPSADSGKRLKPHSPRKRRREPRVSAPDSKDDRRDESAADPFSRTWSAAASAFRSLLSESASGTLSAVVEFCVRESQALGDGNYNFSPGASVPTCALLTGVNLPDHEDFFEMLCADLRRRASPHVAVLRSGDSKSQRIMMQSAVEQLMMADERLELKRTDLTLATLNVWYANQYPREVGILPNSSAEGTKQPLNEEKPLSRAPLIVVLEDFESFSQRDLQDFILNIVEYSGSLPFVFIFGVATTVSVIHQKLPNHVSSYLPIEKFSGLKATEMLAHFIEKVVMDDGIGFKLGGKCLDMLLEIFLFCDFSVSRFIAGYKYCLLEHFSSSPLVPLLCTSDRSLRLQNVRSLSSEMLDQCRSLPSFRRFVEADVKRRAKYLVDDKPFAYFLVEELNELDEASRKLNIFVAILYEMTRDLPGSPMGKKMYTVYLSALSKNILESHEYRESFQFLSHLAAENLRKKLSSFIQSIQDEEDMTITEVRERAEEYLDRLDALLSDSCELISPIKSLKIRSSPATPKNSPRVTREDLKKQLLEQAQAKKRIQSPYESLRKEVLDFFHEAFKTFLMSPTRMTFHELKFFDRVVNIRRHLTAFPRGVIKAALEDPFVYLANDKLDIEDRQEIPSSFPDVAIAYKLLSEAGKLINLYDWMQAWISIVDQEASTEVDDTTDVDPVLQARFTRSVSALQYLGFIKASKRKTDHMAKLT